MPDGGPACELREFNWSRIPGTVSGPTLSLDNIRRMTEGLAAATRLGAAGNRVALAAEVLFGLAVTVPVLAPLVTGILMLALDVDFWGALRIQLGVIAALLTGAGIAAFAFMLEAVFAAVRTRDTAPLAEWLRWLVLMVARPIVLVCLLPFAPFLWEFLTWGGETSKVFTWLAVTGAFAAAFGWLWGEPWVVMGNVAVGALVVAGLCLAWFAGQLVFALFGPTLKALLDVFRYVGDGENRIALRNAFDRFIADLPSSAEGDRVVAIYAHSLGTVIALDSLLRSTAWTARDDVRLVTCGSPVRRLVMRFFPRAIFPRGVDWVAHRIAPRLRSFQWVNFYRRFDYVGGSLGLTRLGIGRDIRSSSLTKAHSGYFADAELWSAASAALAVVPDLTARRPAGSDERSSEPDVGVSAVLPWVSNLVQNSGYVLAPAAAILFAVVTIAQGGRLGTDPADEPRMSLQRGSQTSPATVTHWRESRPGDPPDEIDHFRFEWEGAAAGRDHGHARRVGVFRISDAIRCRRPPRRGARRLRSAQGASAASAQRSGALQVSASDRGAVCDRSPGPLRSARVPAAAKFAAASRVRLVQAAVHRRDLVPGGRRAEHVARRWMESARVRSTQLNALCLGKGALQDDDVHQ